MRVATLLIIAMGCGGAAPTTPAEPKGVTCQPGPDYAGSMHAESAYSTMPGWPEPTAKRAQSFTCANARGVIYRQTFATAADVALALAGDGGLLWGAAGPTPESTDELLSNGLDVAIASGPAVAELARQLEHEGFSRYRADRAGTSVATRFSAELDCSARSKDPLRAWCVVTQIETSGFTLPDKAVTLFGISVPIRPNDKIRDSLNAPDHRLNTLTMDAGHLQFRDVKPENADEHQQLVAVARGVVALLYHEQTTLPVSPDLAGFADGQRANAASGWVARSDPHGLHFTAKAPARAYLVDNAYVIVEDGPDVTWVSVYPVAAYVAR